MELNRQMMDDVRTAQSLQISLLPLDKQKFIQNFIDMEISYMPMQSVGGDYYDFYRLDDNNLLLFLGDASGHGVYAAMIWAILKVEVEELIENKYFDNLAQAFTLLNQRITRILENTYSYATLFACLINLENRTVHFISAGHTDQLYFSSLTRTVKRVRNKNPIIGTFKNAKFTADSINISRGDVLLLFSDGIVEGINPDGRQLGKENLEKILLQVTKKEASASNMISDILIQLEDFFEGTLQKDDRTLMVIKL
jgi:sigma-B regulation protein RsbU (phosphoserine phosphatase)